MYNVLENWLLRAKKFPTIAEIENGESINVGKLMIFIMLFLPPGARL